MRLKPFFRRRPSLKGRRSVDQVAVYTDLDQGFYPSFRVLVKEVEMLFETEVSQSNWRSKVLELSAAACSIEGKMREAPDEIYDVKLVTEFSDARIRLERVGSNFVEARVAFQDFNRIQDRAYQRLHDWRKDSGMER